jgi:hypothetical protein
MQSTVSIIQPRKTSITTISYLPGGGREVYQKIDLCELYIFRLFIPTPYLIF